MHHIEEHSVEGLLLLQCVIDFEKGFVSIEWNFITEALEISIVDFLLVVGSPHSIKRQEVIYNWHLSIIFILRQAIVKVISFQVIFLSLE